MSLYPVQIYPEIYRKNTCCLVSLCPVQSYPEINRKITCCLERVSRYKSTGSTA